MSDAENCLNRVKTKPVSLKSVLVPTCAVLITIATGILKAGVFPVLPEFQYTLAAVTDTFYSMDYRSADEQTRQKLGLDIERKLQKMLQIL